MSNVALLNKSELAAPIRTGDSIFSDLKRFEDTLRMAEYLSRSDMVPAQYQGKPANVVIAMAMAHRMDADLMMVMQNLYVVHGRPGWSSQFLIACVNSCGKFSALQYEFSGEPNTDSWACRAYATELATGQVVHGPSVSIAMAKAEGWHGKNGSKWKTMPELMLTYRAAAFFVRTKAPEISMGMQTDEEIRDMGDAVVVSKERTIDEPKKAPELPDYSDADFESNLPAWSKLIASGKKTAEQIIATVESKGRLSNDQKAKLMDVKAAPVTADAETGEEGVPQCTQEEFAAKLPEWTAVLQSGKRTAEQLIANIETKCWLTEAQKTQLRGIK